MELNHTCSEAPLTASRTNSYSKLYNADDLLQEVKLNNLALSWPNRLPLLSKAVTEQPSTPKEGHPNPAPYRDRC